MWRDERFLRALSQIISAVLIIGALVWTIANLQAAAAQRGLALGYDFLTESAGFPIGESPISYAPANSFFYAFGIGVLNTLKVALVGVILATVLGTIVGLARISTNWLVSRIALAYIELHRNIPLLVLLFIWYFSIFSQLPSVSDSIKLPGPIYINQRGLYLVRPSLSETGLVWIASVIVAVSLAGAAFVILRRRRVQTGERTYYILVSLALLLSIPVLGWFFASSQPLNYEAPVLEGFNYQGGLRLTPEYSALLVGLVMYTAAFIAEVVRSGIQAVNIGQLEAARAVGLKNSQILSLIIIPQALRVIIPPLISQYLNLTKNSSLALAIGYPDLFTVGRIMINQAGRAVPVFSMIMASYLSMSLVTSLILNVYNRRIQLIER